VRPDGEPGLDGVPELDIEEVPGAEIARRGDARSQQLARVLRHPQDQVRVGFPAALGDRVHRPVEPDMHVSVDQARQQRAARQLDDLAAAGDGRRPPRPDVPDRRPVDGDLAVLDGLTGPARQDQWCAEQLHGPVS